MSPPPTTISPGSRALARLANPSATHQPKRLMISSAEASPAAAAAVTCSPRTTSGSPPARSTRRGAAPAIAISRPSAPSPLPEANRSQHPRFPQGHRGPCGSTTMWPNSPAKRLAPSMSRPPDTIPPPIPVPRVTMRTSSSPWAAPRSHSAQQAAVASLPTQIVHPGRASLSARMSCVPASPGRLGAKRTKPVLSTSPGTPTPTAPASAWSDRRRAAAATSWTSPGPSVGLA